MGVLDGTTLRLMLDKPTPQPNMLINGDFTDPINQRGKTEYALAGGAIDCWVVSRGASDGTLSIVDDGIEITAGDNVYFNFSTKTEIVNPGTYTCCIEAEKGESKTGTLNISIDKKWRNVKLTNGLAILTVTVPTKQAIEFAIQNKSPEKIKVKQIKLEPGERFTGFDYKSRNQRLNECLPYGFLIVGYNRTRCAQKTSAALDFPLPCPRPLHKLPTLPDMVITTYPDNKLIDGFTFEPKAILGGVVIVRATKAGHNLTDAFISPKDNGAFIDASIF